ncbi:hypothetical protein [Peribacillus frigoritolerans]|uniref:hypothetical protein n=1 Tax=Peribacillus frigoritolerans TaxID=450367 RepID=UPI002079F6A5|nr:hypothetical protein [Peribacillus frigoritolerans]USK73967.1 hypothetical protein LIT31_19415 [Peribacillus frigoritolerans]
MATIEVKKTKDFGLGSLSFVLCLSGILFTFDFGDKSCMGDHILHTLGISGWSNGGSGIHYTVFYSAIFFIPSFIIGHIYPDTRGATAGKIISGILSVLIVSALITFIISFV